MVEIYRLQPAAGREDRRWCRSSRCNRRRCRPGTCARRPIGSPRRSRPAAPTRRRTSRSTAAASSSAPAWSSATRPESPSASSSRAISCRATWRRHARRIAEAYEDYSQLRVLKGPLEGVYLSLFLMMTLMILVSATWLGLYLAKRITRPVGMLAAGGQGDRRRPPRSPDRAGDARRVRIAGRGVQLDGGRAGDEPAAPRTHRASRWSARTPSSTSAAATSRRCSSGSRPAWCRSAPTAASARSTRPPAACSRSMPASSDRRSSRCSAARISLPLGALVRSVTAGSGEAAPRQEIALAREGREIHLAAAATALQGEGGRARRHGPGVRRRDAAGADAARRGVARRGAAAGARDQEPADADPVVRRAHGPALRRRAGGDPRARGRVHHDDRRRGRVAEGAGRRVRAVRAHAGAARGARRT